MNGDTPEFLLYAVCLTCLPKWPKRDTARRYLDTEGFDGSATSANTWASVDYRESVEIGTPRALEIAREVSELTVSVKFPGWDSV